jgi:ornithine cyclodeaminase/alanine dehydrogenase-like protein (mu-crystallin family)
MPVILNKRAVFISNEEVISFSDMESYIEVVEQAYKNYGEKKTVDFQRQSLWVEMENQPKRSLKLMAGATPDENVLGGYIYSGGYRRQRGWQKCLVLFDFTHGDVRAIIESDHLSWLKTGAVSAVAAKYLSRENAKTVGLFGAGKQAVTQLEGLRKVRRIKIVKVYSRTEGSRKEFCSRMSGKLGIDVISVNSPQEAVEDADIVVAATTSKVPVFDGRLLQEGVHVNAIGAHYPEIRELDEAALRGHKMVVDLMDSVQESGEFCLSGFGEKDIFAELPDVVSGKKPGRESSAEVTVFKSGGKGFECVALGSYVYGEIMRKSGIKD